MEYKDLGIRYDRLREAFEDQQEHIRELEDQAEELRRENQEQGDTIHELRNASNNDTPENVPDNDALNSIFDRNEALQAENEQLRHDCDIQKATYESELDALQDRLYDLQTQLEAAHGGADDRVSRDEDTSALLSRIAGLRLNHDVDLDETQASLEQRIQELQGDLGRAIAEAERHESKLQHCGEQRQELEDRLRDKENFVEHLKERLDKERSAGECTRKCEELEKKLLKLVRSIRTNGEAVNKVLESVMEDVE
jgi:chromosome segregation ATPase